MQTKRGTSLISSPGQPAQRSFRRRFALIVAGIALLDLVTKSLALALLGNENHQVLGNLLSLHVVYNSGAAFSFAPNKTTLLTAFSVVTAVLISIKARAFSETRWILAAGLVVGGITGNLMDRVFRAPGALSGEVIDWIQIPHWPTFNFADSAIVIGAGLAALLILSNTPTSRPTIGSGEGRDQGVEHE